MVITQTALTEKYYNISTIEYTLYLFEYLFDISN